MHKFRIVPRHLVADYIGRERVCAGSLDLDHGVSLYLDGKAAGVWAIQRADGGQAANFKRRVHGWAPKAMAEAPYSAELVSSLRAKSVQYEQTNLVGYMPDI